MPRCCGTLRTRGEPVLHRALAWLGGWAQRGSAGAGCGDSRGEASRSKKRRPKKKAARTRADVRKDCSEDDNAAEQRQLRGNVMQLRNNDARLKHLLSRDARSQEDPETVLQKNICSQKTRLRKGAFIGRAVS